MAQRSRLKGILVALALAAPAWSAKPKPEPEVEIPSGTLLSVELVDPVSTGKNKAGEAFRARVLDGVWVRGAVAVPPGATVRGELTKVTPSGRVKGRSELGLSLKSLELDGRSFELKTDDLSYVGEPHAGKNIGGWLSGALQGAVLGVLFGGKTGAIIGAGAGAGAGGVSSIIKGKEEVDFAQGARLLFETRAPLKVPAHAGPPPAAPAVSVSTSSAAPPAVSTGPARPSS
ncbi:MAG TPA: hypothetical protein VNI01_06765 [Elusimicrobiota bacterium]|jgi:hypothetical protein|nr:hypothetical protein [Elusimicrobiota bacterium]